MLEQVIRTKGLVAARPAPVQVLTALLTDRPSALSDQGPEVVTPLISALSDLDPVLAYRAKAHIQGLKNQAAIDELCEVWSRTRTPDLDAVISRGRYVAARPPYVRVLSAIQAGQGDALDLEDFTLVQPLVLAASDKDQTIAAFAKALLTTALKTSGAQDALCKVVIRDGDPLAERIAQSNHYKPLSAADKALFYFLTEQWIDYEAIDFDMGLLRESYQRAGKNLRARISGCARRAGRLELVEHRPKGPCRLGCQRPPATQCCGLGPHGPTGPGRFLRVGPTGGEMHVRGPDSGDGRPAPGAVHCPWRKGHRIDHRVLL